MYMQVLFFYNTSRFHPSYMHVSPQAWHETRFPAEPHLGGARRMSLKSESSVIWGGGSKTKEISKRILEYEGTNHELNNLKLQTNNKNNKKH